MSEIGEIIDTDIVIVGGGVAGSALAAALRNSGHRLVVIDQRTGPIDTSRGDHFSPVNVEAFADWGILDGFFAKGATKRIGHEFRTSSGEVLVSAEYAELGIKYPYFLVYHHDLMAETFQEFAAESKNYQLFQPYAAKSFDIEDGTIKSVTAVSPEGKCITVRAHLVIASDGAASPIRAALRFPTFEHPYRRTMVAFFAMRPNDLSPQEYFFRYSDPSGVLVIQQRNDGQIKITMPIGDEGVPWWKVSSQEQRAEVLGERAHSAGCRYRTGWFLSRADDSCSAIRFWKYSLGGRCRACHSPRTWSGAQYGNWRTLRVVEAHSFTFRHLQPRKSCGRITCV